MRPSIAGVRLTLMLTLSQLQVGSDSEALAMPQCCATDVKWCKRSGRDAESKAEVSLTESSSGLRERVALEAEESAVIRSQARGKPKLSSVGSSTRRRGVSWIGSRSAPCGSLSSLMPDSVAGEL